MNVELERFDPAEQNGRIAYEHLHRYALCREFVTGRRVLDLACGTGYGTAILGTSAAEVTGVDISAAAIRAARKRYARDNVRFAIGDCFDLPFENSSFDVVVANEMIEHVEDHAALIAEIRRVLADKGLLLVSTPNKPVYNRYKTPNVFHVSEMEVPEFRKLLTDRFRYVQITGIRMALLSVAYALDPEEGRVSGNLNAARIHLATGESAGEPKVDMGELHLSDPEYVLAMCSDAPLEGPPLSSSIFFDERQDLWLEHEKIMAWASNLHDEDELLRADVVRTREQLEDARASVAQLEVERADIASRLEQLSALQANLGTAVESERAALARETEAVRREAVTRLSTLAELLGRMGQQPVAAEDRAILSSLFQINETLVTERLQRAQAEERSQQLTSRIEALQIETAEIAKERALLAMELAARGDELGAERQRREELEAVNAALSEETRAAAEEKQRLAADLAERGGELEAERQRREELEAVSAALSEEVRTAAEEKERLTASLALHSEELVHVRTALEEETRLSAGKMAAMRAEANEQTERLTKALRELTGELEAERKRHEEIEAARAAVEEMVQEKAAQLALLRQQIEEREAQSLAASISFRIRGEELSGALDSVPRASAKSEAAARTVVAPTAPEAVAVHTAPIQEDAAETALGMLHRRTAATLGSAPARIAGRIASPPERAPLPWHRKVLGKQPVLDTVIFSSVWLERQDPRLSKLSLRAFLTGSTYRTLSPHPLFDAAYYLGMQPDVAESGMSPLVHYVLHGWREGRDPHPLFANDWYLAENPDVAAHGALSALDHYLIHGWREGRRPNPLFDPKSYLQRYPDVQAADFEPLTHYMLYGESEGRELAIDGWSRRLPDLAEQGGPLRVMERLLRELPPELPPAPSGPDQAHVNARAPWPPAPVDDFWPAQTMREMIAETFGEPLLSRIWYLLSLMNRWQDRQAEFAASDDCRQLLDRLRELANASTPADDQVPSATVIIPVYNNVLDTLLCLASLLELQERHDFEVIVADDGSTDATAALVTAIGGIVRYVRQPRNLGFLGNCNAAATQARGETIVLLNNDTLVLTGWLDGLLDPIEQFAHVGLVGSKLINWDGTLQEAGGIFWRDGSAWNFGRNQDARAPEFNYLKDVDYCSGASIAVPARIWCEVGGFDSVFSPAYCEDSDLAFRLREAGYRTLYSPASVVVHHEGRSHGRDVTAGIKAYQVRNMELMYERWHDVLEREHYPNAHNVFRARDRSFAKRHVLIVDHYVMQPDRDAGSRSMYDIVKALLDSGWAVTLWPDNLWRDPEYTPRLQQMGVEVIYGPAYCNGFATFLEERAGLFDAVLLSRPHIAVHYLDALRCFPGVRVVYYGHDIHFERMAREARLKGTPENTPEILKMKSLEVKVCAASDVALYPSEEEAMTMASLIGIGSRVQAIPLYRFSGKRLAEARERVATLPTRRNEMARLLFVGGFAHPPNENAIKWFCEQIAPLLRRSGFPFMLNVVGSKVTEVVRALDCSDVRVLGFVSDERLGELYSASDIVIAPLRFGAGVKGKVLEAMGEGVPVVTTSIGAQGIDPEGRILFLAETAEEFASKVKEAAQWPQAKSRVLAGIDLLEAQFSDEAMTVALEKALSM